MSDDSMLSKSVFERPWREFTTEEIYNRGLAAERILQEPMFQEALQEAERTLTETLLQDDYPIHNAEGKIVGYRDPQVETYAAKRAVRGLGAVETALRAFIADGQKAKNVLEQGGRK